MNKCIFYIFIFLLYTACKKDSTDSNVLKLLSYKVYDDEMLTMPANTEDGFVFISTNGKDTALIKVDTNAVKSTLFNYTTLFDTAKIKTFRISSANNCYTFFTFTKTLNTVSKPMIRTIITNQTNNLIINSTVEIPQPKAGITFTYSNAFVKNNGNYLIISTAEMRIQNPPSKEFYIQLTEYDINNNQIASYISENLGDASILLSLLLPNNQLAFFLTANSQQQGGPVAQKINLIILSNTATNLVNKSLEIELNKLNRMMIHDNNFIMIYTKSIPPNVANYLIKMDFTGNIILHKILPESMSVYSISKTSDGYLLSGSDFQFSLFENKNNDLYQFTTNSYLHWMLIDDNCNLIESNRLGEEYNSLGLASITSNNSSLYFIGIKKSFLYYKNTIFFKINRNL